MTQTVTLKFNLTQEDFEDIINAAGYSIGYWATEGFITGETYNLIDAEFETFEITKDQVELAMANVVNGEYDVSKTIQESVTNAITQNEFGEIDGDCADVLIQLCCFDEIVYA